ncbi:ATP-binding protein [Hyalangium minutum]|uniref:histidine kinase n=1 Tax=Hyalangium minutum TaxID=394096 RepID=A0A085WSX4_9BACT|nr:ATP-binding protein [Hyalangium minutum]KFE70787.1 sensory box histidine kinase/response regulator [Hyalangium minutum]
MKGAPALQAAQQLIRELSAAAPADDYDPARVASVLAGLEALAQSPEGSPPSSDAALQEVADALFGIAALDFSKRPQLRGDGSVLDAVIGCVNMLSEELAAYHLQRNAIEQELERRVESRTLELSMANAQLRHEIAERIRTEKALLESEAQLSQASKMEAMGKLSGGIAHDFNNLLSVIISYTVSLLEELPTPDPMREDLEQIRRAGMRASELTRQLLAFSRRQVMELKAVNLNELITNTTGLLHRLIGEDIELKLELEPQLGLVRVDPGQFVQVIMNLAVNSRDAMPQGGTLTLCTANVGPDGARPSRLESSAGPCVRLCTRDTGVGMDAATMARIFEPFFTTKGPGAGTGLGLSTVFGIVKQSSGTVHVQSEPGKGASFEIDLPRYQGTAQTEDPNSLSRERLGGTETILLTEDDDQVRHLAERILRNKGYEVLVAARPGEALELFRQYASSISLLVTDVVMPQMSGRVLAEQLRASCPGLKVLYMSGYTEDISLRHGVVESLVDFMAKPITPDVLLRRVREILDS